MKSFLSKFLQYKLSPNFLRFLLNLSISILFGSTWFLLLYGHFPLHFSHVDWIYRLGGDIFQHQLGWEWFRQEPWSFPLGRIEAYGYPFGTYVTYMDSIPLLAIPFKLLSPLLKQNFQYLGLWELASVIGQMLMGILILQEYTQSYPQKILGASLLVLSPPMIFRAFSHDSLTAQWILLAGFLFIILEYRHKLWRGAWLALFAVAMLVHLYFVAMLLPLWIISLYFRYCREKKGWALIVDILIVISLLLIVGYSIGLFSLHINNLQEDDFGFYSWNLNGFLNPIQNSSTFFKELALGTGGQYEGFSYLGLGNLFILPIALIMFFYKDYSHRKLYFLLPFVFIAILFIFIALSNKAFLNAAPIWNIPLPKFTANLFSIFRSSGRFIWPVFYFLVLFGLISLVRNIRYPILVLILALLLQLIDIQPFYVSKRINGFNQYQPNLQSEFWQNAAKTNQHIILIPATWPLSTIYEPIALYARQNKLTLNWGYFSRAQYDAIAKYAEGVWEDLKVGRADKETIYIFWDSDGERLAQEYLSDHMLICQIDGFSVVFSVDNKLTQINLDLSRYCVLPSP